MKFVLQTQDSSLIKERLLKQKLTSQILTTQQLMFFVIVSWWTQFLFSGSREPNISISRNILSQLKMPFLFWKRWPEWPHLTQDALSSAVLAEDATISEEGALAQLIGDIERKKWLAYTSGLHYNNFKMGSHLYIKMAQGGRNSSSQFRNLQVHGESRKSSRAEFLLQESSMPVTPMNMTGDILCCFQTQSETLQDFWDGTCEPKGANIVPSLWCHTPWLVHQSWAMLWIGFVIAYQEVFTWRARLQEISLKKFPDQNVQTRTKWTIKSSKYMCHSSLSSSYPKLLWHLCHECGLPI